MFVEPRDRCDHARIAIEDPGVRILVQYLEEFGVYSNEWRMADCDIKLIMPLGKHVYAGEILEAGRRGQ